MSAAPGDAGLQLQYAGILLASHQDVMLGQVMQRLQTMQLTPDQRTDLGVAEFLVEAPHDFEGVSDGLCKSWKRKDLRT